MSYMIDMDRHQGLVDSVAAFLDEFDYTGARNVEIVGDLEFLHRGGFVFVHEGDTGGIEFLGFKVFETDVLI